jgi:hypothetical protein
VPTLQFNGEIEPLQSWRVLDLHEKEGRAWLLRIRRWIQCNGLFRSANGGSGQKKTPPRERSIQMTVQAAAGLGRARVSGCGSKGED